MHCSLFIFCIVCIREPLKCIFWMLDQIIGSPEKFFHQKMWIFIFWTPCMAKIAFYWLGLSIFEKMLTYCSTSERQNFSGDPIMWSSIQKMHFRGSHFLNKTLPYKILFLFHFFFAKGAPEVHFLNAWSNYWVSWKVCLSDVKHFGSFCFKNG